MSLTKHFRYYFEVIDPVFVFLKPLWIKDHPWPHIFELARLKALRHKSIPVSPIILKRDTINFPGIRLLIEDYQIA